MFAGDLLDYYDLKVPVKVMVAGCKVAIDGQGICSMDIIPVLIYPLVGPLFFDFSYILIFVTFHAECQVNGIFRPAIGSVPDLVSSSVGAGEEVC